LNGRSLFIRGGKINIFFVKGKKEAFFLMDKLIFKEKIAL